MSRRLKFNVLVLSAVIGFSILSLFFLLPQGSIYRIEFSSENGPALDPADAPLVEDAAPPDRPNAPLAEDAAPPDRANESAIERSELPIQTAAPPDRANAPLAEAAAPPDQADELATKGLDSLARAKSPRIAAQSSRPVVKASRTFAGPSHFPPKEFAGYGIVAFPESPNRFNRERFLLFCEAYSSAFLTVAELRSRGVKITDQMVTIWPISDDQMAIKARERATVTNFSDVCKMAVENYGAFQAQSAILHARYAQQRTDGTRILRGRGPFLLAWSPGSEKGTVDTLVLVSDLSDVSSFEQALAEFRAWRQDIQLEPDLWRRGWSLEKLRIVVGRWADRRSNALLELLGNL